MLGQPADCPVRSSHSSHTPAWDNSAAGRPPDADAHARSRRSGGGQEKRSGAGGGACSQAGQQGLVLRPGNGPGSCKCLAERLADWWSAWWGLAPSPHPEQHREPQDHQQECVKKQVVHHLSFPFKIGETERYYWFSGVAIIRKIEGTTI